MTADELKAEILEKTAEYCELQKKTEGFRPGETRVHYAGRVYDAAEMQALVSSALDFWLTLGPKGEEFIRDFSGCMGMKHGLAVNSGSSANLVAVGALCSRSLEDPLRPGDEVITSALAFPTTLNPVLQNGLVPVFLDVEEGTYNLDASLLESALSEKTRAIVLAHTLGNPAQMDVVTDFADRYGLYVVEDACDALDSVYNSRLCGTFGDVSTFSFYAAHHITMGEGGAVLTNDIGLYRQALSLRDWGRACYCRTGEPDPNGACGKRFAHRYKNLPFGYDHKYVFSNIGYNLKPLDLQCAVGIEQLKKLPRFTAARKRNFQRIYEALLPFGDVLVLPRSLPGAEPSWFAFPITVRDKAPFGRRDFVAFLEQRQIETRMLFVGNILRQPAYEEIRCRVCGPLLHTESVLKNTFFVGVYPGLTEEMLDYMIQTMRGFLESAGGRKQP